MLSGKKALVVGVANQKSLAWAIAKAWSTAGAQVGITYQNERLRSNATKLAESMDLPLVLPCDVTNDQQIRDLFNSVKEKFGNLDILLHSVAFAPSEALKNPFLQTTREAFALAHDTSAYSLVALSQHAVPLMASGSSITSLSYIGSVKAVPNYNVMGPAKASLEACVRQLAYELGDSNIRVNCISTNPINTLSSRGIPGIHKMMETTITNAPLHRNSTSEEIGAVATFLASDAASCITGQTLYADCGFNSVVLTK